eukprot:s1335_g9.t1
MDSAPLIVSFSMNSMPCRSKAWYVGLITCKQSKQGCFFLGAKEPADGTVELIMPVHVVALFLCGPAFCCAFTMPCMLLEQEAKSLDSAPLAEVLWAARHLKAERAAAMATSFLTSLNFMGRAVCGMWSKQMQRCIHWALWPLVPALQQLAARWRLDGRLEESLDLFRRADEVVRSVVPLSNIHLRLHSELLMTCRSDATLAENLWLVAAGFGSGLQVWQTLVGFRVPRLAARAATLPAPVVPGCCIIHFRWEEGAGSRSLLIWSAAFRSSSEICLDASKDVLIFNAPNAEELKVSCSNVDVARMETKFSRKRRCLTVTF